MIATAPAMTPILRDRVLQGLGIPVPPAPDLAGLELVYRAWCDHVPFDNVRKMIALRKNPDAPLPGIDAPDFFEAWLATGVGGTCWPTSNALGELLESLGFNVQRVSGAMRDAGFTNHGSLRVTVDAQDYLADSSMLCNIPLPLGPDRFLHPDPIFRVDVQRDSGTHLLWIYPPNTDALPCRLDPTPVTHDFYFFKYDESRTRSPFNQRLHARRNRPGALIILNGYTRVVRTAQGVEARDLTPDELCQALHDDIGLSTALIDDWARSGSLADSYEPALVPPSLPTNGR